MCNVYLVFVFIKFPLWSIFCSNGCKYLSSITAISNLLTGLLFSNLVSPAFAQSFFICVERVSFSVDAFNILALTFTNKAAAEMKARVEKILGNSEARNLYIGTFHSVFARILRSEAPKLGFPSNFTIYDTDDAKSVVKTVIKEMELDDKQYKPNVVYNRISSAKNALVGPAEYANDYNLQQEDARANRPMLGQIYDAYNKRCFKNGAMDFDDLLFKMYILLKKTI